VQSRGIKGHYNVYWRTWEKLTEERDEKNEQFSITEIQRGGCSLLVLNQGKGG
jgi:hypothetical protein